MKKLALGGIVCLSLFLIIGGLAYAEEKIACVNFEEVFSKYHKTEKYEKILDKEQKDFEEAREKKVNDIKKFQEKLSLLSEEERETRRNDLEDKIAKLRDFDRDSTQDLRKRRNEKVQEIYNDIKKTITDYAQRGGFTLVFDKRALIYDDESMDITGEILKIVNKQ